ncbi:hypothetical protein BVX97_00355, partial [bacterium E08(2017)]
PHTAETKSIGLARGSFGIIGLETAIGVTYTELVKSGELSIDDWVSCWTVGPAEVLGMEAPCLAVGKAADITIVDIESEWQVDANRFCSKSRNCPFEGMTLSGRAVYTICDGRVVYAE